MDPAARAEVQSYPGDRDRAHCPVADHFTRIGAGLSAAAGLQGEADRIPAVAPAARLASAVMVRPAEPLVYRARNGSVDRICLCGRMVSGGSGWVFPDAATIERPDPGAFLIISALLLSHR